MSESSWLIIGIGNRLRCDDAVGPLLADRLSRIALPHPVTITEHSGEGMGLINAWQGYRQVILIDAMRSGAAPGAIRSLDGINQSIPGDLFHYSSHQLGLAEAVEMARTLQQLPETLQIFGIEGVNFAYGETMSAEVESNLPLAEDKIVELIRKRTK